MLKNLFSTIVICSSFAMAFNNQDVIVGARIGIQDLTSLVNSTRINAPLTEIIPGSAITLDIERHCNNKLSVGSFAELSHGYKDINTLTAGLAGFYHITPKSHVGASLSIQHFLPANEKYDPELYIQHGNIHTLQLGINIRNMLSENVYSHIGLTADVTPYRYHSYELRNNIFPLIPTAIASDASLSAYGTHISIGYIFNET